MRYPFHASRRSTVGIEWELMLADAETGDLVPRAPEILPALKEETKYERHTVTGELLTNTVEATSGIGLTVASAIEDIADALQDIRRHTDPRGIALLSAGSHPFAKWFDQSVSDKNRYNNLIERTQWWGRNMMIWGIHVHIGVEDPKKVMPLIGALTTYLPHFQALAASSPFWAGETTGYASNRALVFQQLPTAGLPWPMRDWEEFESYLENMTSAGVFSDVSEVRWDIRPAPRWGTIEVRACDGMSTLPELAAVAALIQTLVEYFSRELDQARELPQLQPWYHRENKWRSARYGLEATTIVDAQGRQSGIRECLEELTETLLPVAEQLHCEHEFSGVQQILRNGASYARQQAVAETSGGDLHAVVQHLIAEFRDGPDGRETPAGRFKKS